MRGFNLRQPMITTPRPKWIIPATASEAKIHAGHIHLRLICLLGRKRAIAISQRLESVACSRFAADAPNLPFHRQVDAVLLPQESNFASLQSEEARCAVE